MTEKGRDSFWLYPAFAARPDCGFLLLFERVSYLFYRIIGVQRLRDEIAGAHFILDSGDILGVGKGRLRRL